MVDETVRPTNQAMQMKKALLFLTLLFGFITAYAETWTPVGQAVWHEGIVNVNLSAFNGSHWNVTVERSDEHPELLRMQPYANHHVDGGTSINGYPEIQKDDVYVYLDISNPNKIFIKPFTYVYYDDPYNYHRFEISQRVPENGFDTNYYGKLDSYTYTIEFGVGSFKIVAPHWANNPSYISNTVHKIVLNSDILGGSSTQETWVNIGQGYWIDPFWTRNNQPLEQIINIEKSIQRPNIYRTKLFNDSEYITINTENSSKVFISPYSHANSNGTIMTVTQNCAENGMTGSKYGTFSNGRAIISGDSFVSSYQGGNKTTGSSSRKCEITFPDGFDNPLPEDNGVFMGIIGFNDEIVRKPISLLNENTKSEFTDFVNGLQMGDATLLYYAVDQAISSMKSQTFPENLGNAMLITFTDGLDEGSLAMKPEYRTSQGYADYLSNTISNTSIQGHPLEAYAIGLKSEDVYDDDLFMYNLQSLATKGENISTVRDVAEMQQKLTALFENLEKQTSQRVVTIKVPMMSHGDKYRFTLDHCKTDATSSNVWFEGVFNIDNLSLENVVYHGFTSTSGQIIATKQDGIKLIFSLNDCRDENGNILDVDNDGIDEYRYIPSRDIWNHNKENAKKEDIDIQNIKSSVAIMFALDCSTSLGDLFPLVKSTANSFIDRLAGGDGGAGVNDILIDADTTIDINDPSVEIYNLQGIRVMNPTSGLYICRKGNLIKKILIK